MTGNIIPIPPVIIMGPTNKFVDLFVNIELLCISNGHPPPSIDWFKDDELLQDRHMQRLLIQAVDFRNRGFYHCVASNSVGMVKSRKAVVTFKGECQHCMIR